MKISAWLLLLSLLLPGVSGAAELMVPNDKKKPPGIFFPESPFLYEVLRRAEEYPRLETETRKLSELVAQDNAALTEAAIRSRLDAARIADLGMQLDNCFALQVQTVDTMEEIQKIQKGTWLDYVKNAALFILIGGALGYAVAQ